MIHFRDSRVPQGSELFNIFINDLFKRVQGMLVKFGDDTKLGGIAHIPEDRKKIQEALNRLRHWDENNRMKINRD